MPNTRVQRVLDVVPTSSTIKHMGNSCKIPLHITQDGVEKFGYNYSKYPISDVEQWDLPGVSV